MDLKDAYGSVGGNVPVFSTVDSGDFYGGISSRLVGGKRRSKKKRRGSRSFRRRRTIYWRGGYKYWKKR